MIADRRAQWPDGLALAAVMLLFCAPLFVGLGNWDLQNDEAIYSYSVMRILETGEWLTPRAIPFDGPFLEKPPLKFWMVAAPMALGLLPADEVGLRAIDALLGGMAFVYVFLLGRWLAGPVCGIASVLVLYTIDPLVYVHGLRSNDMEAALVLCYAGGVYHFARWVDGGGAGRAARHRWPVALYFTLGFMTKFVAILFLPLVCAAALAARRDAWRLAGSSRRAWLAPAGLCLALIAPWFVYQTAISGWDVWKVMFLQHVYTRFTGALDVSHLQPWPYYFSSLWDYLREAGSLWIAVAGAAALAVAARRSDGWLARIVLFWGIVPTVLVSFGSSKIFHYIYPFLPPVALAAGYAAALVFSGTIALFDWATPAWLRRVPAIRTSARGPVRAARTLLIVLAAAAALIGLATALFGEVSWKAGGVHILRNSSLVRPFLLSALLLLLAGQWRWTARAVATALLMMALPAAAYPSRIERALSIDRPLHATRDCIQRVRASGAAVGNGLYATVPSLTHHGYNFYLRELQPWLRVDAPDRAELRRRLTEPGHQTPVILSQVNFVDMALEANPNASVIGFTADHGVVVVLPGPYESCAAEAARAGAEPVGFASARQ